MKKVVCACLVLLMALNIVGLSPALADKKKDGVTYKTLDYNDILRNPMSNWGVKYYIEGTVLQIFRMENKIGPSDTYLCFKIATKNGYDNAVVCRIDNSFINAISLSNIIEGDKVAVYCSCDGKTNFTTVIGSKVSLPIFKFYEPEDIQIIKQKK